MSCDYCFLDLNHGRATVIPEEAALKAVDAHLEKFGAEARFTILGGEPLIHFPVLRTIAGRVHAKAPKAPMSVVTNGTLACPEKLSTLESLGVSVTVSLDGRGDAHDRHRKLAGGPGSSLEESLKALEACDKSGLRANMVVCRDTVDSLLSNVEFLRETGFKELSFHLNVIEEWTPDELRVLEKTLAGFARYYKALQAASPGALRLSHIDSYPETALEHGYEDVVLGADGRYYPCDGLFALPYRQLDRWSVGDAASGVDWGKREDWHRVAREFIHPRLERPGHFSCARETYFRSVVLNLDPDPVVRSFHAADEIMGTALRALGSSEAHAGPR